MSEMFEALMRCAQIPASRQPRRPAALPTPNYEALVEVLTGLYQIPDGLGETILRPEEAAAIRACGFGARAGSVWRCPLLPDALVCWNPLLRHLSDAIDPYSRQGEWKPKRAPARLVSEFRPIDKVESKILRHLSRKPPYCMSKRHLQQRMWRYSAKFFNRILNHMLARGRITLYQGLLYPYSAEDFAYLLNKQEEERRAPKRPRYTV
jgi:hypothetical protein